MSGVSLADEAHLLQAVQVVQQPVGVQVSAVFTPQHRDHPVVGLARSPAPEHKTSSAVTPAVQVKGRQNPVAPEPWTLVGNSLVPSTLVFLL